MKAPNLKRHIHQSNLIEGYDDPAFDAQGQVAWDYLLEVQFDQLDAHCIRKVQKIVTLLQDDIQPDQRGYYRKVPVWIGGREALAPALVPRTMDHWLMRYQELDAKTNHINFERIHPFVDGNGRTGRLLMWWQQYWQGQKPTLITYKDRQKYYDWFRTEAK